ncbi:TPA: hypothetical protein NPP08_000394 [Klebsiella quasipneumoniae subsp. similipneumoniae]|nr:hypothetical protein [Klebsiella quasipneumoniae]HCI6420846.1 hypothetical protein [Klebsiella quasipneumoniae subsp. similipneumoniae]
MTDITELAQSWKTAAHKAKQANDLYLEGKITLSECVVETKDYLDYSDNPNNFLALVEALEKVQQRITQLESRTVNIKFAPIQVEELGNVRDGKKHPYMFGAGYNSAVIHCESVIQQELDAKGIKWEAE